jgi:hypothetical protein
MGCGPLKLAGHDEGCARHMFALYPVKKTRDKHVSGMYLHRVVFDMNGTQHTRVLDVSGYI